MSPHLRRNLAALSLRDPRLAARIESVHGSSRLSFLRARSGAQVPAISVEGRPFPLHSLVDPEREGKRFHAEMRGAGYLVFLGLAAGYHIVPFRQDSAVGGMLVVEQDVGVLRSLLEALDLEGVLGDPRVRLLADAGPQELERALLDGYLAAVMGKLRTLTWRPRCDRDPGYFSEASRAIAAAVDSARADYSAQARFGRRWFTNILLNLPRAESAVLEIPRSRTVLIAGAGPSLEPHIEGLGGRSRQAMLIAVDTALPALHARGIRPDLTLSIDCQQYSYHHFFPPGGDAPRLLDLASPPLIARGPAPTGFFAGGHPLCGYVRRHWRAFPALDTSGGNVAYAAVSLADRLGAQEIVLYGVDFSYPDGKPYARGTYLTPLFGAASGRFRPADSSFFHLMFSGEDTLREEIPGGWRYTTPLLRMYAGHMERLGSSLSASLRQAPGKGQALSWRREPGQHAAGEAWGYPGAAACGWRDFLRDYLGRLESLSPLSPPAAALRSLPADEREVWTTVLPLAAFRERETGQIEDRTVLLEDSRAWMMGRIQRALS